MLFRSCFFITELHELFVYFDIKSWSVTSFAKIFSHSIGCLFALFMVSFAVQKLLGLIRPHLFIFAFILFWAAPGSLWDLSSPTRD